MQDGKLEELRLTYDKRCSVGSKWKSSQAIERNELVSSLTTELDELETDRQFLAQGLQSAVETFQLKINSPSTPLETLKSLNWDIFEYKTFLEQANVFNQNFEVFIGDLDPVQERPVRPILRSVKKECDAHLQYLLNLYKKKRVCATHVLVFMIADERRNRKPYAIPIQYVPYRSIRDQEVRDFTKKIKEAMVKEDLKVVGKCFTVYAHFVINWSSSLLNSNFPSICNRK